MRMGKGKAIARAHRVSHNKENKKARGQEKEPGQKKWVWTLRDKILSQARNTDELTKVGAQGEQTRNGKRKETESFAVRLNPVERRGTTDVIEEDPIPDVIGADARRTEEMGGRGIRWEKVKENRKTCQARQGSQKVRGGGETRRETKIETERRNGPTQKSRNWLRT